MTKLSFPRLTRDQHLFGPGPKRILSLDGGGVLGIIEIAFLERIETELRAQHGDDPEFRLCDYFDLIGGTSIGAIIATGLALGRTVAEMRDFLEVMAPEVFKWKPHVPYYDHEFDAHALANKLRGLLDGIDLQSPHLKTGLAIVAKRVDTASPWVLTNNPRAVYWEDRGVQSGNPRQFIDNREFQLDALLRASSAAPMVFSPKRMLIAEEAAQQAAPGKQPQKEEGLFIDGGVSPHNNPSLLMLMLAGISSYGFKWRLGADNLMMTSIGSGWVRPRLSANKAEKMPALELGARAARGIIWDNVVNTLKVMQWLSEPRRPWPINSEVGDLKGDILAAGIEGDRELLTFQRFDVAFDAKWVKKELGRDIPQVELTALDDFTNPDVMVPAYELAKLAAERHVTAADFPLSFHLSRIREEAPEHITKLVAEAVAARKAALEQPRLTVAVTGHRLNRLPDAELARIRQQIEEGLRELQGERTVDRVTVVTGLAEGTDRIAAEITLKLKMNTAALLPFGPLEFAKDFETVASRREFDALFDRATSVTAVNTPGSDTDRDLGYAGQGVALVRAADALITVWDGAAPHGPGGTAEVVAAAIAKGIPVLWISTEAGAAMRRLGAGSGFPVESADV